MTKERLLDCVKALLSEQYIMRVGTMFIFTKKFNQEFSGVDLGVEPKVAEQVKVTEPVAVKKKPGRIVHTRGGVEEDSNNVDWIKLFQEFVLQDARIPPYGYNAHGVQYALNGITKPAREAFKKILLEGVEYDKLAQVTRQYYSGSLQFKTKIETYLGNELWRTAVENPDYKPKTNGISNEPKFG